MSKKHAYLLVLILIFVVPGFIICYWSGRPSFAVIQSGYAVFVKNRSLFEKTANISKIAEGLADDTMAEALRKLGADPLGSPGLVQSSLAMKMVESLKPQMKDYVFKTVDSYFSGEPIVNSSGESLKSVLLMLLASNSDLKFNWHLATEMNPDFAIVTVGFLNTRTLKPIDIRMRLEKEQSQWRLVRLYNVIESLAEQK
jgi:hypothetical protein